MSADENGEGCSTDAAPDADGGVRSLRRRTDASAAFERLGNGTRMAVLGALLGDGTGRTMTFSALRETVGERTSAGFAYHLRKLVGQYVEKTADGYRLTYAGRRVARAVVAGTYTETAETDPLGLDDPCPVCGESALTARCTDNVLAVECDCLDRPVAVLELPPGGHRRTDEDELLYTADRHHRYQTALMADGICPECAGPVEATLCRVPAPERDEKQAKGEPASGMRAQLRFGCEDCGRRLRSPVAFAVVEHPAVVGFFAEHGTDVRERPLWNLGEEWSETVLSTEPWCVRVSIRIEEDRLDVLVGEGMTVRVLD